MNATVKIQVGVVSKTRMMDQPFKPTNIRIQDFQTTTDLENYDEHLSMISSDTWIYAEAERAIPYTEIEVHCSAWLDNVTHPPTAKGVIKLPKGHRDTHLSDLDFTSAEVLEDHLRTVVTNLKNIAKY